MDQEVRNGQPIVFSNTW